MHAVVQVWRLEEKWWKLVLSFYQVGLRDELDQVDTSITPITVGGEEELQRARN